MVSRRQRRGRKRHQDDCGFGQRYRNAFYAAVLVRQKGTAVGSYFNYTFRIPVGKALSDTSCGAQTYTVYVEDAGDPTGPLLSPLA